MVAETISIIHGFLGMFLLMSFSGIIIGLFDQSKLKLIKYGSFSMLISSILIFLTGTLTYIFYRAPGSAREKLLASSTPWVHSIFMELKEFMGVYVVILMVVFTYMVYYYKDSIFSNKNLKFLLVFLLVVIMLMTLLTFGLGAYITKVQPI